MSENTISTQTAVQTEPAQETNEEILSAEETAVQEEFFEEEFPLEKTALPEDKKLPQVEYEQDSPAENPPQEETVQLTVYGETLTVPVSEARAAAQKGMAFDYVKAQLAQAKNDSRLTALEDIARIKGISVADLIGSMHSDAVTDRLVQQYGSIAAAPWQAVSSAVMELEQSRQSLAAGQKSAQQQHWKAELREFLDKNPGCRDIPQEVLQMAKQGQKLSYAYSEYKNRQLTQQVNDLQYQLEVLKGDAKARKASRLADKIPPYGYCLRYMALYNRRHKAYAVPLRQ